MKDPKMPDLVTEAPSRGIKIFEAIQNIKKEIKFIGKDNKNPQQGYSFRGIDDLYNALHPLMAEHGVISVPEVLARHREERPTKSGGVMIYTILSVKYRFYAIDGSFFESIVVGEAADSGDKSCNKAMSAAHKYCFIQVFDIPTEEIKDTENENPEFAPQNKDNTQKPFADVLDAGDYVVMFGKFKGMAISSIPPEEIESYIEFLNKKEPAKGAAKEFCDYGEAWLEVLSQKNSKNVGDIPF